MNRFIKRAAGKVVGTVGAAMLYVLYRRSVDVFWNASQKSGGNNEKKTKCNQADTQSRGNRNNLPEGHGGASEEILNK